MNARNMGEAVDDDQVIFRLTSASRPYLKPSARYGVGSVLVPVVELTRWIEKNAAVTLDSQQQ